MKDKVAAKTRLQTTTQTLLKNQINARLKQIDIQIRQVDVAIAQKVAQDEALSQKLGILISIPGIAEATAFSMLIEMPELGTLEGKQAASLAGLAPISRQSGKWQGKERIQGGRAFLRRAIYMPALVATRYNPDLKAKYDQLKRQILAGFTGRSEKELQKWALIDIDRELLDLRKRLEQESAASDSLIAR
jgi:transposase